VAIGAAALDVEGRPLYLNARWVARITGIPFPACSRSCSTRKSNSPMRPNVHSDATAVRAAAGRCGLCGHVPGLQAVSTGKLFVPNNHNLGSHVVGLGSSMSIPIPGNGWNVPEHEWMGNLWIVDDSTGTLVVTGGERPWRASGSISTGRYRGAAPGTADRPPGSTFYAVEEAARDFFGMKTTLDGAASSLRDTRAVRSWRTMLSLGGVI